MRESCRKLLLQHGISEGFRWMLAKILAHRDMVLKRETVLCAYVEVMRRLMIWRCKRIAVFYAEITAMFIA